eukprot:2741421-Lingulodinium_polyedra.AAC.1
MRAISYSAAIEGQGCSRECEDSKGCKEGCFYICHTVTHSAVMLGGVARERLSIGVRQLGCQT